MKKIIISLAILSVSAAVFAQQMPISENFFMDRSSLSPSYGGHFDPGTLFTSYRSDWSGIDGGPKTLKLSYSDDLMTNATWSGRFIYDKAGIFNQLYLMGTYSYSLRVGEEHRILMALSAGLYQNRLNYSEYYNDPDYNIDPVLSRDDIRSKLKFMSDFSAVYLFKGLEAGFMFANINFGDAKYPDIDVSYKPLANYQFHAAYSYPVSDRWLLNPLVYYRDGKYIKGQIGIAARMVYQEKLWGSISFRDPSIWGIGLGAEVLDGIRFSYNFNFAGSVELNLFNNHEVALGIDIRKLIGKGE